MTKIPNIILIYTDQQRFDTIHALGNPYIQTPTLDYLVNNGITFTQATTPSPVCMPDRWSLHTGQWTTTHQCYSNHHPGNRPTDHLPGILREGGYYTGLIGKNHSFLTPADFDEWHTKNIPEDIDSYFLQKNWIETNKKQYPRLIPMMMPGGISGDPQHANTQEAFKFIKQAQKQPFFLWLSYLYPHTPYHVPDPFFSLYQNNEIPTPSVELSGLERAKKPFRHQFHQKNNDGILPFSKEQVLQMRRVYYGMISFIDHEIGRLLEFLSQLDLLDNTLIIFTSDHGDYMGDHGLITKSPSLYDCLVRVPFILFWRNRFINSRLDNRFASHVDILPTLLEIVDMNTPETVQGKSLLPFLLDKEMKQPIRHAALSEYGIPGVPYSQERLIQEGLGEKKYFNPFGDPVPWEGNPISLAGRIRMVRTESWKYVQESSGTCELYDLQKDPGELINLWNIQGYVRIQSELEQILHEWKTGLPGIELDSVPVPFDLVTQP